MRLIDADALKEKSRRCFVDGFHGSGIYGEIDIVLTTDISTAPTVDAAPVMHGRWVFEYWKSGYIKRCNCSECGNSPKDAYSPPNYCDNCGAKMDGKDDT